MNIADNIHLDGHFIQGGLAIGKTAANSQVFFNQQAIRVSPQGDFLLAFDRDESSQIALRVISKQGKIVNQQVNIAPRKYHIQRINGLKKSKISPKKPAILSRIAKENAQVAQARLRDDARLDYLQTFIWPTKGPISGVYGSQRVLNGEHKRPHYGVDIAAPAGTPVRAPASGIISLAHQDMFYSGGTIILDHGHGLSSAFLHLSRLRVKIGDKVKQGDLIALVGATGRVTGAHLDWRINLFKRRIDPQLLVPPMNSVAAPTDENNKL